MNYKEQLILSHENDRLTALKRYNILDTLPENAFDDATKLVSYICGVPIAHISFVDETRQWIKSEIGLGTSVVPREISFCQYTILDSNLVEIPDTYLNDKFKNDPNVIGGLKIRFYAGIPLTTPDGFNIGTICAIDHVSRELNDDQRNALSIVAKHVINLLELRTKNIELDAQKKIAEHAVLTKDTFLTNMSHDIRTPLNAIIGFTDLLAQTELNTLQHDYIDSVQKAGNNLLLLVNDILDLSKIESGHVTIHEQPFNVKNTLKHIYNLLKVKATRNVEFNLFLDADLPEIVIGDPGRLNQILVNLIGNALKFTEEGEVTVSAKIVAETESQYSIQFSVKDTGIGIAEHKLKTIFERFTQAEDSITRRFGGTGLGLNIVKQLIELHGTEIHVKSEKELGSEFFFVFNYKKTNLTDILTEIAPKENLGKLKILLCEDNLLNQKLIQQVVTNFGFELDIAENGSIGIDFLTQNNYDIILMDLQMPVKDGYQTTQYIRTEMNSTIPIIAMTAHSLVSEQEHCYDAGMNGYVPKPFKQEVLLEAIKTVLSKKIKKMVDLTFIDELSSDDPSFKQDIIALFIEKIPSQVEQLEEALLVNDHDIAQKVAHNMKSSLNIFMLKDTSDYMSCIEEEAKTGCFSAKTVDKIKTLKFEMSEVVKHLQKIQ